MIQTKRWMTRAAVCVALAGVGTATGWAQDSSGAQQGQNQQGQGQQGGPRGEGRRNGRGVRGTVVSASGANVTLKTEQGETWTVITTDNTRVNLDRQTVKVAELKAGDEVMAMGVPDPDKHELHAMMVMGASAAEVAKMKANLGKTYIVGRVTAINDTNVTVMRPDKVSQTMALDESTSLRRGGRMPEGAMMGMMGGMGGGGHRRDGGANSTSGTTNANSGGGEPGPGSEGEAITLADVKVGDNVGGAGALKGGVFVPAELHVMTPRGPRNGGGPGGATGGAASQQ